MVLQRSTGVSAAEWSSTLERVQLSQTSVEQMYRQQQQLERSSKRAAEEILRMPVVLQKRVSTAFEMVFAAA